MYKKHYPKISIDTSLQRHTRLWYFMNNKLILTYIAICVSQVNGVGSFMRLPALSSSKNPGSRHA